MYTKRVKIINPSGLHARPASIFARTAGKYKSRIKIARFDHLDKEVNAKSIVMILSLSAVKGSEVCISAEGDDEREAVSDLVALIENGFGEEL